ncbi:hypothetical protein EfmAA242_20350 [Enterococcus faecium]|nr:hypothetical protein EfmAA242_20350 [Enterococcus faecium]
MLVNFGMVQTVVRHNKEEFKAHLIITDENHHGLAASYRKIYEYYSDVHKYEYIFIMDYNTGKELARVRADGIYRPDVNQAYNTLGNVGYHVSFNMRDFPNKKV